MKWIDVNDRLPAPDRMVLCARTQTSMSGVKRIVPMVGRLNKGSRRFSCEMDWIYVTHWIPLPHPPSNDKDQQDNTNTP